MTSLYYYDAFEYDYDYDYDHANFTNMTDYYTFDKTICTFVDLVLHILIYVFLFMYMIGVLIITFMVAFAPFWVSLLMVLAIISKWNDSKPFRHHSDSAEND